MVEFSLPANSRVGKGTTHKAEGAGNVRNFKVYRYDPDSGDNPRVDGVRCRGWASSRVALALGCGGPDRRRARHCNAGEFIRVYGT